MTQQGERQRDEAGKFLSLVPQHDAFTAGNMPVILFNQDNLKENFAHSKEEAERTINNLTTSQRPSLLFFSSPQEISIEKLGIDFLVPKTAIDRLEGLPLVPNLETLFSQF